LFKNRQIGIQSGSIIFPIAFFQFRKQDKYLLSFVGILNPAIRHSSAKTYQPQAKMHHLLNSLG